MACHCGLSWASWEPLFEVARDSNRIVKSVGTQDIRGNRLVIRRDADGVFRGDLYLNAYLPAPDRPGAATAVVFSIDDRPLHGIDTGTWVEDGPYRRLNFRLSDPPDAGLDAAMIEILEGRQILFSYPAGTLGRESVRFSFGDTGPLAADALGVALPVDHAMHERLRADRLRLEAECRARLFRPVDPEAERARHLLIERQRAMSTPACWIAGCDRRTGPV